MKPPAINVERSPHNGHLHLSTIQDGQLVRHTYIGYSKRDAIQLFRAKLTAALPATGRKQA